MSSSENGVVLTPNGVPIGYVSKRDGARYIGRSARWLNPRLEEIGYYKTDSGRILLKIADLDRYMERFRASGEPSGSR